MDSAPARHAVLVLLALAIASPSCAATDADASDSRRADEQAASTTVRTSSAPCETVRRALDDLEALPEVRLDGDFFEASAAETAAREHLYATAAVIDDPALAERARDLLADVQSGDVDLGPTFGHEAFDLEVAAWLERTC